MIRITLVATLLAFGFAAPVYGANSAAGSAASCVGAMASSHTTSSDKQDKVVLQARDDAAGFVASAGRLRGAQLEAALRHLRERNADARRASDMQLAMAILVL